MKISSFRGSLSSEELLSIYLFSGETAREGTARMRFSETRKRRAFFGQMAGIGLLMGVLFDNSEKAVTFRSGLWYN